MNNKQKAILYDGIVDETHSTAYVVGEIVATTLLWVVMIFSIGAIFWIMS